jgi:O-antigen/teichoic acid export membrane protein
MTSKNLKSHAISGARLAVAGRLIRAVQGIAALSILSRFLTPAEFGLIAVVTFVAGIAQVFTDFGSRVALVQRRDTTLLEEDSVFWWNLGLGAVLTAGVMLFAPQIAVLMGTGDISWPLVWVAPIFLFGALQGVPLSVLERRFSFGWIMLSEVGSALAGSAVAIILAVMGYRLEALVLQQIAGPLVCMLVILVGARWRPRLQFSYAALKPLLSYGGYVTAAGVVQLLSSQADRPVVTHRLSSTDLGYSTIAEQIVLSPFRIIVQMVRKVMFPIMSTIQDDDARLRRGYLALQHGLMTLMAPVAFGLWAVATPLVSLLLGKGWEMVAVLIGLVSIRLLFLTVNDLNNVIFSAKGWARFQFKWSLFAAVMNIGTLLLMVSYGIVAVTVGRLALSILLVPVQSWFVQRLIGLHPLQLVGALVPPILSGFLMGLGVWQLEERLSFGPVAQLAICIPVGCLLYILAEMLLDRKRFLPLLRQLAHRRQKG